MNALAERVRKAHKPYAGAQFRIAFLKRDSLRFLTGSVAFCPEEVASRPVADYGTLLLVEEWQREGEALTLLSRLLEGQAEICGQKVTPGFFQSDLDHRRSPVARLMRSGWEMRSYYTPDPVGSLTIGSDAMLGFGLRPYLGANQAINDWVFDEHYDNIGGEVPYINSLTTFLPDMRGRIVSALWTPGKLALRLEINVPSEEVELQIIHSGSSLSHQTDAASNGACEITIPDDSRELRIYLMHKSGECIMHVHLRSVYDSFGHVPEGLITKNRSERDLAKGEGDQIEFKPFISPSDAKETEIVDTVIAFANTAGGRIYVGVTDRDARPQGAAALAKAFKDKGHNALTAQAERLRWLITNRVAPTVRFSVEEILAFEEPMVAITIENSGSLHYALPGNDVWVRRGASNVRPRPGEVTESSEF